MTGARWRLASLWLSQVARVLADNALRVFVILEVARAGRREQGAAWHLVMAIFIAPALVLSPLIGAVSNTLPRRWVLVGSTSMAVLILALQSVLPMPWLAVWGLIAVAAAIYSPTRYAVLSAAAEDTHLPLTRINGWVEMGAALAIVGGLYLGGVLEGQSQTLLPMPATAAFALAMNLLALLLAIPSNFPSDHSRSEDARHAISGYFHDFGRLIRLKETRSCLLAMCAFRALVSASTGAAIALTLRRLEGENTLALVIEVSRIIIWVGAGAAVGSFLASLQSNPWRSLALIVVGASGLSISLAWAWLAESTASSLCFWIGLFAGFINVPLASTYQLHLPADARGNAMAVRSFCEYLGMALLSLAFTSLAVWGLPPAGQFGIAAGLAGVAALMAWRYVGRALLEQFFEFAMVPMYRIRGQGPGLDHFPLRGPMLVIANHSAYLDPIWLGKLLPRALTAMMTSAFYDIPGSYYFWKYALGVIRVEQSRLRREAPELAEAVAALDRGDCVILFPEGSLRRDEERPLRRFGQGVWRILSERPETPVVVCWIEGGWGSFFSYKNGKPMRNKPIDRRRPIDVMIGEPFRLDAALLEDGLATRKYLYERCLDQRRRLGLADVAREEDGEREP